MRKLLITSFEPFGGENVNSAAMAVELLPSTVADWSLHKLVLPVVYGRAAEIAAGETVKIGADSVLCIGQAAGRTAVTPEMVAINLRYGAIADNDGKMPMDEPIDQTGETSYFSTLPVRAMAEAVEAEGIPARVSYSAGTFVCNDLMYILLKRFRDTAVRVGFIHIPRAPIQGEPSMETETAARAIIAAIGAI